MEADDGDASPTKKSNQTTTEDNQMCDAATFKVPYPYKNPSYNKLPVQPTARRATTTAVLHQPWTQTHTPSPSRTRAPSLPNLHQSWAGWAEFQPVYGGPGLPHQHGPCVGKIRDLCPAVAQPGGHLLRYPLQLIPVTVLPEDARRPVPGYRRDAPKLRERSDFESFSGRPAPRGGDSSPWMGRRRDQRNAETPRGCVDPTSLTPSFLIPPLAPADDLTPREEVLYQHLAARGVKQPRTVPSSSSLSASSGYNSQREFTSFPAEKSISRCSSSSSSSFSPSSSFSSSSSPEPFPWLLPHFAAGSLIELRDGRLKRVEDLRTEDFLLGSAARRGLRLSCCTVQSITSSSSSSSSSSSCCPPGLSRLLILLHDKNSQELVDVYVEYPFFVRGRGWSSCCPERTARICGLSCGQLSVGDVCLALTPAASPDGPPHPGETAALRCTAKKEQQVRPQASSPPFQAPDALEGAGGGMSEGPV